MPWVRLDENAIDHPKFLALSDGAWRLWCEGQTYCQKHLTDGKISAAALRRFRYYSPARVRNLTAVLVEGKGPCWNQQPNGDIQVHDYLDWNDSAAEVLKARSDALERRQRYRDRHASENASLNASVDASKTANVSSEVCTRGSSGFQRRKEDAEDLPSRAGDFIERYKALHVRLRKGAHYIGRPALDFQEALQLVGVYDDARLDKLAYVWLNTDHDFAQNGTRSLAKFRSMASWCEERLIEWEDKHGPLKVA